MAEKKKAPPSGAAPFNMNEVDVIRKKMAPAGPPPARMISFHAPKKVESKSRDERDRSRSRSASPDQSIGSRDSIGDAEARFKQRRASTRDRSESTDSEERRGRVRRSRDDHSGSEGDYDRGRNRSRSRSGSPRRRSRSSSGERNQRYRSRSPTEPARRKPPADEFITLEGSDDEDHKKSSGEARAASKHLSASADSKNGAKSGSDLREGIYNFTDLMKSTYRDLRTFVISPAPLRTVVRCYIEKNKSASSFLSPVYSLCADLEDGTGRELITCRKIVGRSSHYVFSLKADDLYRTREKRSKLYLGKLRALSSNEYVLYDNGATEMPGGAGDDILQQDDGEDETELEYNESAGPTAAGGDAPSLYRSQLCAIVFNSKKRPCTGTERGMEICIPHPALAAIAASSTGENPRKVLMDIVKPFRNVRAEGAQNDMFKSKLVVMHERISKYDALSACLVDFKGRASIASVKNFQIIKSDPASSPVKEVLTASGAVDPSTVILQMGKITKEAFNMDYKGPLSMLQAFAICIARFDANLSW